MAALEISQRLEKWATLAGYTLTPGAHTDDGRPILWSKGGEVRYFIGVSRTGWFVVTSSDRLGPENLELAAPTWETIEKYFFGMFGRLIRLGLRLPRIPMPKNRDELRPGFELGIQSFDHCDRFTLIGPDKTTVAIGSGDDVSDATTLVLLSLYLTASEDDIIASSTDPDGQPLYVP